MANLFFQPGAERAEKVRALFARIASRYDLINDLQSFGLHRRWKRRVVELSRPEPGLRALDVCCGTGDLALGLAERGADVVGVDFSQPMLEIATRRALSLVDGIPGDSSFGTAETGQPAPGRLSGPPGKLEFRQGDALQLPFADRSFDVVTVGYGLRNLADWGEGLREMWRVARPGGRLLVLDFGKPENRLWRTFYFGYLRSFVPVLGLVVCGNAAAYAYILESLRHYPAQRGVDEKMRQLGLVRTRIINFLGGAMSINYGEKL